MKKSMIAILVLLVISLPAFALGDGNTLRVSGTATLKVTPDSAILSVGYSGEHTDATAAHEEANEVTDAILQAVKALGIDESNISTGYVNTYPVYNYSDEGSQIRGYRVEHMLSIVVDDLDIVGDVLDAALAAGANQANNITFYSSKEHDVYLQALSLAVENAASKADILAIASGVWVGALEQVNELSSNYSNYSRYSMDVQYENAVAGVSKSLGSSVIAGDLEVTASVELVYTIR